MQEAHSGTRRSTAREAADECLHVLAQRMARACRHVIQGCLREEEWIDADEAFFAIISAGLKELKRQCECQPVGKER